MNRRRFLSLLGLAAPVMALDPERALWVPGEKTIFDLGARPRGIELADPFAVVFPARGASVGNTLITPDWVMKEITSSLARNLRFTVLLNGYYSGQLMIEGAEIGKTVQARRPVRYTLDPSTT